MTIIAIASSKGGVGKSTLTAAIAVALQQAGRSVVVADLDFGQRSISTFVTLRDHAPNKSGATIELADVQPDLTVQGAERQAKLRQDLETFLARQRGGSQVTLIDLPAGVAMPLTVSLDHADIILSPLNESLMDLYTIEDGSGAPGPLGRQIRAARKRREEANASAFHWAVVLNRAPHMASGNTDKVRNALQASAVRWGFGLAGRLCERVAFREAYDEGRTLLDKSAADEASIQNGYRELTQVLRNLGLIPALVKDQVSAAS